MRADQRATKPRTEGGEVSAPRLRYGAAETNAAAAKRCAGLAQASWVLPAIAGMLANLIRGWTGELAIRQMVGVTVLMLIPAGLVCGVVALAGVRRHGRKGILVPAVIGVAVCAALSGALGWLLVQRLLWRAYGQRSGVRGAASDFTEQVDDAEFRRQGVVNEAVQ